MKNLTKLNGSDITATERETSERRFIRHYSQHDMKPQRYAEKCQWRLRFDDNENLFFFVDTLN